MQSGDTLKINSGNAQIDLTYSPTKFIGFFLEKKKIVSENELQLVRQELGYMGVRRGGQEGALDPPWPAKIVCF